MPIDPYATQVSPGAVHRGPIGRVDSSRSSNSRLSENFRAAELVNKVVAKLFPAGAGNQKARVASSKGESFWRAMKSYQIVSGAHKVVHPEGAPHELIFRDVERAIAFQGGNCDHFASASFAVLASLNSFFSPQQDSPERQAVLRELGLDKIFSGAQDVPKIDGKIHLVADDKLRHVFVVIGKTAFDQDSVVVDAWVLNPKPHLLREGAFQPTRVLGTHDPRVHAEMIDPFHIKELREKGRSHLQGPMRADVRKAGVRLGRGKSAPGYQAVMWDQLSSRMKANEMAAASASYRSDAQTRIKKLFRSIFGGDKTTSL